MSVTVKHLNADSSFLLTFSPTITSTPVANNDNNSNDSVIRAPGSFSILLDPWLRGPSKIFSSKFAVTYHTVESCIASLDELTRQPDLVLISQDKSDHCHEDTLRTLPAHTRTRILGTPAATKRIRAWKHFDSAQVEALKRFDRQRIDETIHRIPIPIPDAIPSSPSASSSGSPGEVTIALLAAKVDLTGLHNAIAITYRPPSYDNHPAATTTTTGRDQNVVFPPSPPATPPTSTIDCPDHHHHKNNNHPNCFDGSCKPCISTSTTTTTTTTYSGGKTLSVMYSPHGINNYEAIIEPYAASHLTAQAALPLDLLLHCIDRATNPWYFGGNITSGSPGGIRIAHALRAQAWIGAHDEEKQCSGVSVRGLTIQKFGLNCVRDELLRLFSTTSKNDDDNALTEPIFPSSLNSSPAAIRALPGGCSETAMPAVTDVRDLQVGEEYHLVPRPRSHSHAHSHSQSPSHALAHSHARALAAPS